MRSFNLQFASWALRAIVSDFAGVVDATTSRRSCSGSSDRKLQLLVATGDLSCLMEFEPKPLGTTPSGPASTAST